MGSGYEEEEEEVSMPHLRELSVTWDTSSASSWDVLIQLLSKAPNLASIQVHHHRRIRNQYFANCRRGYVTLHVCCGSGRNK